MFFFLNIFFLLVFTRADDGPDTDSQKILQAAFDYGKHMLEDLISNTSIDTQSEIYTDCINKTEETLKKKDENYINHLYELLSNSGKSMNDLGLYHQCATKDDNIYFLSQYKISSSFYNDDKVTKDIVDFLEQYEYFYGFCVPKECKELVIQMRNEQILEKMNLTDMTLHEGKRINKTDPFFPYKISGKLKLLLILTAVLFSFLFVKIMVAVFMFCSATRKKLGKTGADDLSDSDSDDENEEEALDKSEIKGNNDELFANEKRVQETKQKQEMKEQRKKKFSMLLNFLNLNRNISILFENKNEFYNEDHLHFIAMIRSILVFLMIYDHNFYALIKIPVKDYINSSFYQKYWLSLVKYSTFGINILAAIEGLTFGFKVMNFIKKNYESNNLGLKLIVLYLRSLSQIATFFIIFFLLNYSIPSIYKTNLISLSPMFEYFRDSFNKKNCTDQPWKLLIPFYLQYQDFRSYSVRHYNECYKYAQYFSNIHYCMIISMILIYCSIKFRKSAFDYFILVLLVINGSLTYFSCKDGITSEGDGCSYKDEEHKKFTIGFIFGETCSTKFTHLFMNDYFIGVICGLTYFYYIDIVSSKPLQNMTNYIPFKFCFNLMKFIDSLTIIKKSIVLVFSGVVQVLFAISPFVFINSNENFHFRMSDWIIYGLDLYEKKVFIIFFMVMILVVLFEDSYSIKYLYESNVFTFISRISFSVICGMDTIIYLFYTSYYIQVYLNYHNMFFMTSGLMFILCIIGLILTLATELPLRMLIKMISMKSTQDKIEDQVKEIPPSSKILSDLNENTDKNESKSDIDKTNAGLSTQAKTEITPMPQDSEY